MHAVVRIAGKQFLVRPHERLRVPRLAAGVGDAVDFAEVLCVGDESGLRTGTPLVDGARVVARVVAHARERRVIVFKKKRRKDYRRTNGHRQPYSEIEVETIQVP